MGKSEKMRIEQGSGLVLASGLLVVFFVILFLASPAQGLQCYECTNDDDGCFIVQKEKRVSDNQVIPDKYKVDCAPRAVGCVHFEVAFDFIIGNFLHRSCLYSIDMTILKIGGQVRQPGSSSSNSYSPANYRKAMYQLKINRSVEGLPPPVFPKRELPKRNGYWFAYSYYNVSLANRGYPMSSITSPSITEPEIIDITCNFCESEMDSGLYLLESWNDDLKARSLPFCKEDSELKSIRCKGAYGCSSFWEGRRVDSREVLRVWRDCWYPGEMKCLRKPEGLGRSLSKKTCRKFTERKSDLGNTVLWDGLQEVESLKDYVTFLNCVKGIRERLNVPFDWSVKEEKDVKDPQVELSDGTFAKIRYFFCSPTDNCTLGKEASPTTMAPTPSSKVTIGGDKGGGDDCDYEEEDERKGSGVFLQSAAYLVQALIFCSVSIPYLIFTNINVSFLFANDL